jgi:hypothetical protein
LLKEVVKNYTRQESIGFPAVLYTTWFDAVKYLGRYRELGGAVTGLIGKNPMRLNGGGNTHLSFIQQNY